MPYVVPPMEKMNMRMGMRMSSLPFSFFTSAAMPASSAPVSVTIPKKPPMISTNKHTGNASVKPLTGAVATSATVAPVTPCVPAHDMMTVMMASAMSMTSRMVNDDMVRLFLSFLAFSTMDNPSFGKDSRADRGKDEGARTQACRAHALQVR